MSIVDRIPVCGPKLLPDEFAVDSAQVATEMNPANRPHLRPVADLVDPHALNREFIAALTTRYWRSGGVHLGVRFLDTDERALKDRILSHLNAWAPGANIGFEESRSRDAEVRIARTPGDGYWSYLGTDILQIGADEPTMNLDSFSMNTPEREYSRVVRHEAGHTLGFPHEHLRREVVERIDAAKAIRYFRERSGWTEAMTRAQVLTPIEDTRLIATPIDTQSIMCYQLPGSIMADGHPVPGGLDINDRDRGFVRSLYPVRLDMVPLARAAG